MFDRLLAVASVQAGFLYSEGLGTSKERPFFRVRAIYLVMEMGIKCRLLHGAFLVNFLLYAGANP